MPSWGVVGLYPGEYPFDESSLSLDMKIREVRILRSHLCGTGGRCQDPGAHFTGTDEEWGRLVDEARKK